MNQRTFCALASWLVIAIVVGHTPATARLRANESQDQPAASDRPNFLWITSEDICSNLRCFGDSYAVTPNLDQLAQEGVRYTHAFATAPVCSPARSCLITGLYATSLGTQNLRSTFPLPQGTRGFPAYLRGAGYFCTNNEKTDYNTSDEKAVIADSWNESSNRAHWRHRKPGQPFFSVFNLLVTHQSRASAWSYDEFEKMISQRLDRPERHDPAKAPVPPFYPDTPLVRRSLARYYDCITAMDREVGRILAELAEDGLADNTIVFFFGDNGMGMPRGKRTLFDTGLREPLIIRVPPRFSQLMPGERGTATDRLVSFVDFAPTMLSLSGLEIPASMQGTAFLGSKAGPPRDYVYGARDRVDEAFDVSRSVRDGRYLYIRNYMPQLSWHQPEAFSDTAELRQEITRLARAGQLNVAQLTYAAPTRPREALYDSQTDPHQLTNLADSPEHRQILERMRERHQSWLAETRDVGFLPESDLWARLNHDSPRDLAVSKTRYPQDEIVAAAALVGTSDAIEVQRRLLHHADPAVRYWAAVGLQACGGKAMQAMPDLCASLADRSPIVRIAAAQCLAAWGDLDEALPVLRAELASSQLDAALQAARALQYLGGSSRPCLPDLRAALQRATKPASAAPQHLFLQFSLKTAINQLENAN